MGFGFVLRRKELRLVDSLKVALGIVRNIQNSFLEHEEPRADADLFLSRTGQTRMPSDAEYENAVRTNPTYTQRNAFINYILTSSDGSSKESNTLYQIANGDLKLSIEHVMPQTLTKEWEHELGADEFGIEHTHLVHDQYIHTLANLTLTGYNSEYSNRSFDEKKTLVVKGEKVGFNDSDLRINKWIAAHDAWNEETLKERQDWWIENLQKVWPLPQTNFKPVEPDTTVLLLNEQNLKGKGIRSVQVFGDSTLVGTWAEALDIIAESVYDKNPDFFDLVSQDEFLFKYFKKDSSGFNNSAEILDTGYYLDTGNDTNTKLRIVHALGKLFELSSDDIKAELVVEKSSSEIE
jgi:hypothetical protein